MTIHNGERLGSAPTQDSQLYPDTDGKPMAVSDEHRRVLTQILRTLEHFFTHRPEVYVSGDLLMYYVQGDPRKSVAPDVLVSFGIGQKARRTYLVWQEGKPPDFVMELASESTYQNDLGGKMQLYAHLGIADYFLCDIEGLYLPTPLMGFTLVDGVYQPIAAATDGSLHSAVLGLDFHLRLSDLRLYDPEKGDWLLTPEAAADARAEQETARAEQEAARAEQEAIARRQADARAEAAEMEVAELRAALDRLQENS
ncbi:Uma2 family endonuclease [Candidatus Poribacteria bacterium]|nr:Uma2 family endonuclease [Candidatus Poribacteria bacterium]MXY28045.1 Uma2 family endonuclease [Candidatus Poribacteria bacterium]MYK16660.1 Uma2 family endonuclease [Candidatus Poribacteria bacterium]